jgi:hypothetical protein
MFYHKQGTKLGCFVGSAIAWGTSLCYGAVIVCFRSDRSVGDGWVIFDSVIITVWQTASKLCHLFRHISKQVLVNKALNLEWDETFSWQWTLRSRSPRFTGRSRGLKLVQFLGHSLRKIIQNYKYKIRYKSEYLLRAPARKGPWRLRFFSFTVYTITLGTLSALTCLLRYVKLLMGYGGSSSNDTVFTICLLINFYLKCNI